MKKFNMPEVEVVMFNAFENIAVEEAPEGGITSGAVEGE